MKFRETKPELLTDNPFKLIGTDWTLITAGAPRSFNTMTASWGGLGVLWDKKVCFCFIRPTRHTYSFVEKAASFTLSFFDEQHRKALTFCGTHSGRDTDKIAATGLTPVQGRDRLLRRGPAGAGVQKDILSGR
jgi:flavin reductase (DIM6/NTAB) family NADH-FMN oxidoreductase RutF